MDAVTEEDDADNPEERTPTNDGGLDRARFGLYSGIRIHGGPMYRAAPILSLLAIPLHTGCFEDCHENRLLIDVHIDESIE